MSHTLSNLPPESGAALGTSGGLSKFSRMIGLMLYRGPKRLVTSRISTKCAALMMFLCSPSILFCAVLTIPAMLFQSPNQEAYFYFSKILEQDPGRWLVMPLTLVCTLLALAIPATMPEPSEPETF